METSRKIFNRVAFPVVERVTSVSRKMLNKRWDCPDSYCLNEIEIKIMGQEGAGDNVDRCRVRLEATMELPPWTSPFARSIARAFGLADPNVPVILFDDHTRRSLVCVGDKLRRDPEVQCAIWVRVAFMMNNSFRTFIAEGLYQQCVFGCGHLDTPLQKSLDQRAREITI